MLTDIPGENEVSLEWFSRLKEYDSLLRAKTTEEAAIKEQETRVLALEKRRDDSLAQLSNLKEEYVRLQQKLQDIEEKIRLLQQQRQRWIDQGGDDKKRLSMDQDLGLSEETGLEVLQALETNENERKDLQTFLSGLGKTLDEIRGEAHAEIEKHQSSINQLITRLDSLLEILPVEFKELLLKTLKKNLAHGPFTRIENGSCFFCRYKISRMDESEIDMQKKLKTCPQCSRIFIPYGT